MKNRFEYILFVSFSWIFRFLGLNVARRFAFVIAFIFYFFIPIRKETTIQNLTHAFPEFDQKKIKKITFGCYKSFAITLIEILYMPWISENEIRKMVKCDNFDLLNKRHSEGKGLILLSAHFGNWEFGANSVAMQMNQKILVVVKPLRNPFVTDWMNKRRTKWNNDVVSLGISIRQIYKALKQNNIVGLVADQRGSQDSIKLEFFGRKTSVQIGPAVLAIKTGAPLIYIIPVREKDFSYKAEIVEISTENLPESEEEKIEEITRRSTQYLEKIISENPEQWLWMHNRWKH